MAATAVTALLCEPEADAHELLDQLVNLVYDELKRMAHRQLVLETGPRTLDTTGLVHEAYLKLVDEATVPMPNRRYFFGAAARAMRQVLVDVARRRQRLKRGGGERPLPLDEARIQVDEFATELLQLHEALRELARVFPRPAEVVECRYFGGLSLEETARALGVSPRTVRRDWLFARAWLHRELAHG
ncbi:MAG: ECF-type sigma factor [Thermoanaerobaculia bacterium]